MRIAILISAILYFSPAWSQNTDIVLVHTIAKECSDKYLKLYALSSQENASSIADAAFWKCNPQWIEYIKIMTNNMGPYKGIYIEISQSNANYEAAKGKYIKDAIVNVFDARAEIFIKSGKFDR